MASAVVDLPPETDWPVFRSERGVDSFEGFERLGKLDCNTHTVSINPANDRFTSYADRSVLTSELGRQRADKERLIANMEMLAMLGADERTRLAQVHGRPRERLRCFACPDQEGKSCPDS
jgi:hypothetical protein